MHTRIHSICKSALLVSALALSATAHAGNNNDSFEDGQKNAWGAPTPSIHVNRHGNHGWGQVEHDWHFDTKHHGWGGWGGWGNHGGGIGVSPIPEPQSVVLLLAGLAMLTTVVRRKAKAGGR